MSEDIRISVDFLYHRKTKKLRRSLGDAGVLSAIALWSSTARQRPTGILIGYTVDDIEIDANWEGDQGVFVETLLDVGFLDEEDGVYSLHNWKSRQGWVSESEDRADKARFSRLAQVNLRIYKELKDKGVTGISKDDYQKYKKMPATANDTPNDSPATPGESPAIASTALAPSPSPAPSPALNVKENPGEPRGSFSDFSKQVKPKATGKDTMGTAGYFKAINLACLQISELPAKKKAFNPHQWAQKQVTDNRHPGAVAESLEGLVLFWPSTDSPWGTASTILKTKNGNWNEADAIAIHEEMKVLNPKELEGLTHGLFKNVKS
ncbi:MAG: hypothetical protein JEZ12_27610 [Desulfobacterium sp.]|nr:hypothetical protein [Desulfobacterium sp.]